MLHLASIAPEQAAELRTLPRTTAYYVAGHGTNPTAAAPHCPPGAPYLDSMGSRLRTRTHAAAIQLCYSVLIKKVFGFLGHGHQPWPVHALLRLMQAQCQF